MLLLVSSVGRLFGFELMSRVVKQATRILLLDDCGVLVVNPGEVLLPRRCRAVPPGRREELRLSLGHGL